MMFWAYRIVRSAHLRTILLRTSNKCRRRDTKTTRDLALGRSHVSEAYREGVGDYHNCARTRITIIRPR